MQELELGKALRGPSLRECGDLHLEDSTDHATGFLTLGAARTCRANLGFGITGAALGTTEAKLCHVDPERIVPPAAVQLSPGGDLRPFVGRCRVLPLQA